MQTRPYVRKLSALMLVLSLCLINSGCTDLKSIREFTESGAEISKGLPRLATDLSASCKRQVVFQEMRNRQFQPDKLIAITHPEANSPESKLFEQRCRRLIEVEKPLIQANAVLVEYLDAMGALAADELTNYDKGMEGLGTSLSNAKVFTGKEASAITKIASFILKASTEGYRRKKLKNALEENNAHIQTLTGALQRIIGQRYLLQLKNEREQMRSYYSSSILEYTEYMNKRGRVLTTQNHIGNGNGRSVSATYPPPQDALKDPLPIITVKRIWDEDEAEMLKKVQAAQAYSKAVATIGEGHQKLYNERNNLGSKEVLRLASAYGKTIKSLVDEFREAF